ncbi:hypothetical protein CPC08DRAFT_770794 [Agrocybe pediades]|nr:hypothetical protein CPC08DRAFT_770794 [Agrocybe pediades]
MIILPSSALPSSPLCCRLHLAATTESSSSASSLRRTPSFPTLQVPTPGPTPSRLPGSFETFHTPLSSPQLNNTPPPIPRPTPLHQNPVLDDGTEMSNTSGPRMFRGDGSAGDENPQDFINGVERMFLLRTTEVPEATKVRTFELYLKSGSVAKAWWLGLKAEEKADWASLRAAFNVRWPEKVVTVKTKEEQHAELAGTVLLESDLGKRVEVDGVEEFSHVVWADKLERLAALLQDENGLLVPSVRRSMPKTLRALVNPKHSTWDAFCEAVRTVSITELTEKLEMEKEHREIQAHLLRLEKLQNSPTRALREALSATSLGAPVPPPRFTAATARVPSNSSTAPQQQFRPDNERLVDILKLPTTVHPNTPEGRRAYQADLDKWATNNPLRIVNEFHPYPLTPGTSPILSGECWKCGCVGHMNTACTATVLIPQPESKWRSIAASVKRKASVASVNLVGATGGVQSGGWVGWDEYDAHVIARYLSEREQGNEEGSSA